MENSKNDCFVIPDLIGDPVPLKNLYISLRKWIPCQARDDNDGGS